LPDGGDPALPDLHHCASCGEPLAGGAFRLDDGPGLVCRAHATPPRQPVRAEALLLLQALHAAPGRQWPELHSPAVLAAAALPARWLATAIDLRPRLRPLLFRREATVDN
jgi:hypothetical protein